MDGRSAEPEQPLPEPSVRSKTASVLPWLVPLPWLAWGIVRTLGVEQGFPAVALIALTPYVALLCLLPVGLLVALRRWGPAALALAALVMLAVAVVPRALGGGAPAGGGGPTLRVMSLNFEFGAPDAEGLVRMLREDRVDALAVEQLGADDTAALREAGLAEVLPYRRPRGAGTTVLYTADPLGPLAPGVPGAGEAAGTIRVPQAGKVELIAVHTEDPTSREKTVDWQRELDKVAGLGPGKRPRVLAGDFNATLDNAEFRDVLDSGFVDAGDAVGAGLTPTFPAHALWPPPVTIDHVLVDESVGVTGFDVTPLPTADHRAVLAELELPPNGGR